MVMPRSRSSVHRIEHLVLHLARLEAAAELDEPVGERRFAVIDMGDDREITNILHESEGGRNGREGRPGQSGALYV